MTCLDILSMDKQDFFCIIKVGGSNESKGYEICLG